MVCTHKLEENLQCHHAVIVIGMALPMILQTVSPMLMGHTAGYLMKAMSQHATKADRPLAH